MAIKTVNTILYCRKWQETVAFYQTQLGLKVTTSRPWFVEFELNEASRLSIADEKMTSIDSSDGKGITITLEVDDIEAAYSYLHEAGLKPTPTRDHPWGAKVVHLYDPEGNRIEFWSPN
ncbi:MAG: VOC family protein [Deltaproteobacteria bacterium]|nr:VOC family protein [Candidatus Anaeroferrophillus wilburensis]MBN2888228.1 VOC family protein [Deltaproteobacteria bacterium]